MRRPCSDDRFPMTLLPVPPTESMKRYMTAFAKKKHANRTMPCWDISEQPVPSNLEPRQEGPYHTDAYAASQHG